MKSPLDDSDFVDADFQASKNAGFAAATSTAPVTGRPPTRDELDSKVSETQQRLAELKAAQEKLERERSALEEARRRQIELQTGREETVTNLTRGVGILEEAEFSARRDAEQMAKTISELREATEKLRAINQESWSKENWNVELTRALTTIENARMEWNSARMKWPVLSDPNAALPATNGAAPAAPQLVSLLGVENFPQLCRVGFALTWPVLVAALAIVVALLVR
ncbi:MAG TPA: hypothetical protein VI454_05440 [Verrucomicrobiae bacterium]|jgi:hypothetical protein